MEGGREMMEAAESKQYTSAQIATVEVICRYLERMCVDGTMLIRADTAIKALRVWASRLDEARKEAEG